MHSQGTITASKGAILAFGLVFLISFFRGSGMTNACVSGAAVALVTLVSIKVVIAMFYNALVDELSEFVNKDKLKS
jgi:hypothetical protein